MRLDGKIALITGSSRGIGKATAVTFAKAGADVVVNYLLSPDSAQDTVEKAKAEGVRSIAVQADLTKSNQVAAMFQRIRDEFGTLDILINSGAPLFRQRYGPMAEGPTVDITDEEWHGTITGHLTQKFYTTREALKIMLEKRSGKIVNVSSTALIRTFPGTAAYAAAEAGVIGFTRSLAKEVIPHGINVNCVMFGWFETEITAFIRENPDLNKEFIDRYLPIGRFGRVEEAAQACLFLASDAASYLVGEVISPNGGITL